MKRSQARAPDSINVLYVVKCNVCIFMGFCNFFRIPEFFICVILCADIDECLNMPCKNGATCNNKPGSYSCSCSAGWTGKDCDEGNCKVKVLK